MYFSIFDTMLGDGIMMLEDYKKRAIRFAETRGHKYSILMVIVDKLHYDIIEFVHQNIQAQHCNIPAGCAWDRFDNIIRESALFDGINYKEKQCQSKGKKCLN